MSEKVTDSRGRVFDTKELDPGDLLDLLEAAGSASGNSSWLRLAMVVCSVTAIDGVPVPFATQKVDITKLAKQIGNDGLVALNKSMFGDDKEKPSTDEKQDLETAKN